MNVLKPKYQFGPMENDTLYFARSNKVLNTVGIICIGIIPA